MDVFGLFQRGEDFGHAIAQMAIDNKYTSNPDQTVSEMVQSRFQDERMDPKISVIDLYKRWCNVPQIVAPRIIQVHQSTWSTTGVDLYPMDV